MLRSAWGLAFGAGGEVLVCCQSSEEDSPPPPLVRVQGCGCTAASFRAPLQLEGPLGLCCGKAVAVASATDRVCNANYVCAI